MTATFRVDRFHRRDRPGSVAQGGCGVDDDNFGFVAFDEIHHLVEALGHLNLELAARQEKSR